METPGGRRRGRERRSPGSLATPLFIFLLFISASSSASGAGDHRLEWISSRSACKGTIGECFAVDEYDLTADSTRRMLSTSDYISYGALKRGSVPCSERGASYYNCQPGAEANPYSRGCSAITQCRS